jgi:hypothetical protein
VGEIEMSVEGGGGGGGGRYLPYLHATYQFGLERICNLTSVFVFLFQIGPPKCSHFTIAKRRRRRRRRRRRNFL